MTDKELLQQALDALTKLIHEDLFNPAENAIEAIKARLAQPEETVNGWPLLSGIPQPEPVAWMYEFGTDNGDAVNDVRWYKNVHLTKPHGMVRNVVPLYTAPQKKEWVGLTEEEKLIAYSMYEQMGSIGFVQAIEAKLKEKNSG